LLTAYWVDDTAFELAETEVDEGHWSRQNKAWDRYQRQTAKSRIMETITLEETWRVISAAEQKAEEINCPMDIAVVDAGGNLKAHVRMDGAFIGRITISINKAYIAIAFQGETKDLVDTTQPGQPLFGLSDAHGGNIVIFPGGISLLRDGEIVGAIGVSTGTVEQDQEVAEAVLRRFS